MSDDLVVLAFVIAAVALCVSGFMSVLAFVCLCVAVVALLLVCVLFRVCMRFVFLWP